MRKPNFSHLALNANRQRTATFPISPPSEDLVIVPSTSQEYQPEDLTKSTISEDYVTGERHGE